METMDSMINIGEYGIWEWGINLKFNFETEGSR